MNEEVAVMVEGKKEGETKETTTADSQYRQQEEEQEEDVRVQFALSHCKWIRRKLFANSCCCTKGIHI